MSLRTHTLWSSFGNISSRAITFISSLILARLLFPEDFGLVASIQAVTGLVGLAASNGWSQALIRKKDLETITCHSVFIFQIAYYSLSYILLLSLSKPLSIFFNDERYALLLPIAALALFGRAFQTIPSAILTRRMEFLKISIINISVSTTYLLSSILFALLGFGVWSLIFGQLASTFSGSILYIILSGYIPKLRFSITHFRSVLVLSYRFVIIAAMEHLHTWAPIAITSKYLGFTSGGLFQRALGTAQLPTELIFQSMWPPLFRKFSDSDKKDMGLYFERSLGATILYVWPLAYMTYKFAHEIIYYLYGYKWLGTTPLLQLLSPYLLLFSIYLPCRAAVSATTNLKYLTAIRTTSTLLLLLFVWHLSQIGLTYVVLSFVVLYLIETTLLYTFAAKLIAFPLIRILPIATPSIFGIIIGHYSLQFIGSWDSIYGTIFRILLFTGIYTIVSVFAIRLNPEAEFLRRFFIMRAGKYASNED